MDVLLTTPEVIPWWNNVENKPELFGIVLLLVLILAVSPSFPRHLSSELLKTTKTTKWTTGWNTVYTNTVEKYDKKIAPKQKGRKPDDMPTRQTNTQFFSCEEVEKEALFDIEICKLILISLG